MKLALFFAALSVPLWAALPAFAQNSTPMNLYIGVYTKDFNNGILRAHFNPQTGEISAPHSAVETPGSSFLALSHDTNHLYAVNESATIDGQRGGGLSAFRIEKSGELRPLGDESFPGGPCHLAIDQTGKWIAAATYGAATIGIFGIQNDGSLGQRAAFVQHEGKSVNAKRQEKAHAHQIVFSPDNRFALVCDLGMDKVMVYRFNEQTGELTPNEPAFAELAPGAGPRHLVFSPDAKFIWVVNELDNTITTFAYDSASGALERRESISTLPTDFEDRNTTAEIAVHPNGKWLYASNRGHDSIAAFAIGETGKLALIGHFSSGGKNPRHFTIAPDGKWLLAANQNSASLVVFEIAGDGKLIEKSRREDVEGQPVCLIFGPNS